MWTLLRVVLTTSEACKLLSDFSVVGRDLSKSTVKAAKLIALDQEKLRRADESAPNDQFITEGGRPAGPGETPALEACILGTETTDKSHPADDHAQVRTAKWNTLSSPHQASEAAVTPPNTSTTTMTKAPASTRTTTTLSNSCLGATYV